MPQDKAAGKAGRIACTLIHMDTVNLDEPTNLPFCPSGRVLLFRLLSKLYERISVAITESELCRVARVFADARMTTA